MIARRGPALAVPLNAVIRVEHRGHPAFHGWVILTAGEEFWIAAWPPPGPDDLALPALAPRTRGVATWGLASGRFHTDVVFLDAEDPTLRHYHRVGTPRTQDLRREPRFELRMPWHLYTDTEDIIPIPVLSQDFSLSGCQILCPHEIAPQTPIRLVSAAPGQTPVTLPGVVIRCGTRPVSRQGIPHWQMGIAFTRLDRVQMRWLRAVLRQTPALEG